MGLYPVAYQEKDNQVNRQSEINRTNIILNIRETLDRLLVYSVSGERERNQEDQRILEESLEQYQHLTGIHKEEIITCYYTWNSAQAKYTQMFLARNPDLYKAASEEYQIKRELWEKQINKLKEKENYYIQTGFPLPEEFK